MMDESVMFTEKSVHISKTTRRHIPETLIFTILDVTFGDCSAYAFM